MDPADGDHSVNTGPCSPQARECGYVGVDGGRIWYRVNGEPDSAKLPLLVVHGGPGMSHHYLLPFTDLANERPVILYDQLAHGVSGAPGALHEHRQALPHETGLLNAVTVFVYTPIVNRHRSARR